MRKNGVKVGETYLVRHSGSLKRMQLVEVLTSRAYGSTRSLTHYLCLNESTGRKIIIKSAAMGIQRVT